MENFIIYIKEKFRALSTRRKLAGGACLLLLSLFWFSLPSPLFNNPTSFIITDAKGALLNASIAADGQWRFPLNKNVPEKFEKCITVFEDKRFFYHPGIDPLAMVRALQLNIRKKRVASGGSTITMQVARLQQKNSSRSIFNKFFETMMAVRLEFSFRKKTILSLYASNAPFGTNVVGLDAAAWRYYGRSAEQLSWGEMATLAVLPNSPTLVHPGKNRDKLQKKRNDLLDKLLKARIITEAEASLAMQEQLPLAPLPLPQLAPHLLNRFKREYPHLKTIDKELTTGLQTTINGDLQKQVNELVTRYHNQWKGNQINNGCALVVEIETGNVMAYVGNVYEPLKPEAESCVDVISSLRSPGSTLKPLLYASLLSEGTIFPHQLIPDVPTTIGGITTKNFDLGYDGAVPASRALSRSLNIPAVKMLQLYKHQRFYSSLKQMGFTSLNRPADQYGLSLVLGGCEVSPWELAGAYSSMARIYNNQLKDKGKIKPSDWHMPNYILESNNTNRQARSSIQPTISLTYPAIYNCLTAMNEVVRPGEEGLWNNFSSAQKIAWKTGTSFGFRDAWSIGLTTKYLVVVWAGNADGEGRPELTGINTAAPLMFDIFRLLPQVNFFPKPAFGYQYETVCKLSGYKASQDCEQTETVMISNKLNNTSTCPYHKIIHVDATAMYQVTEDCVSPLNMIQKSWFILPPVMEFYYKQRHSDYRVLPPFLGGCNGEEYKSLDLIYPDANARIYVPVEITGEKGKTIFTATHRSSTAKLYWHLDKTFVASTTQIHQIAINPPPGKHVINVVDESGESVTRNFEIMNKN